MENCNVMIKIVRVFVFLILSVISWDCKKKNPGPDDQNPAGQRPWGENDERRGPAYSWRLTVDGQTSPGAYIDMPTDRMFYLDASDDFAREVTLTVTKTDESAINPSFRIYGRFQQCLRMSAPTLSSGDYTPSGIFERAGLMGSSQYAGIKWTPELDQSPVNSKATCKFKVYIQEQDAFCTEGFVRADMTFPASIASVGSYPDGDHLYFVKKK